MPSPRYHWTPLAQRRFIETLADTGSVAQASAAAGKSPRAAYNLKAQSTLFATGWDAAIRIARLNVATELLGACMEPIVYHPVRNAETGRTGWRRADPLLRSGMGMALLHRLDRAALAAKPAQRMAVDAAEQDFEAFLDVVEQGPSRAEILDVLFKREARDTVRIYRELPQTSALPVTPAHPALAHCAPGGHPQRTL